ncbi:MAG: hypothetical protein V2J24_22690 [Pseudomonadales bacterium]|jgi:hypothetical protein|nr:hypothetical protein [Pseudomonadales bacterium]
MICASRSSTSRFSILLLLLTLTCGGARAVEFVGHMNLVEEPGLTIVAPATETDLWCRNSGGGPGFMRIMAVYDVPHEDRLDRLGSYEGFVRDRALPLIRANCDVEIDTLWLMMLRDSDQVRGVPRLFDIMIFDVGGDAPRYVEYRAIGSHQEWSDAQRAALAPAPERLPAIYEDDHIAVHPRERTWCREIGGSAPRQGGGLDLVYRVPHAQRDELFREHYGGDLGATVIEPLVKAQKCWPDVTVYFFREGESEHWNAYRFRNVEIGGIVRRQQFGVSERIPGPAQQARIDEFEAQADRLAWGRADCTGPFCDLPGGVYLQAVHDADADALRRFDTVVDAHVQRRYVEAFASLMEALTGEEARARFSLLLALSDTYLHDYGSGYGASCPDGLVDVESRHRLETYDLYSQYGMYMGQGGGEVFTAHYRIKPELLPLCERICDHFGGRTSQWVVNFLGHRGATLTMEGLAAMTDRFACDDPAVLRFERNLAALTAAYLDDRRAWFEAGAR